MTKVDGVRIADKIYDSVAAKTERLPEQPRLVIVTCAPNFETKKYLKLKRKQAAKANLTAVVLELPGSATTEDLLDSIATVVTEADGVVVQLPLPAHIDTAAVLNAIPKEKDPDCFSDDHRLLAPVVGAIAAIVVEHQIEVANKKAVVLGHGRLVGKPVAKYLSQSGAQISIMTEETGIDTDALQQADILVTGIGSPHFVKKEMVKEGVIVFDAGTSEAKGELVGDVDPEVYEKASLYTPVPGGIGPITIAVLFHNLIALNES